RGRRGDLLARHPPRHLDEGDGPPLRRHGVGDRDEVRGVDPAAGAVRQHERPGRPPRRQVHPGRTLRGLDLLAPQAQPPITSPVSGSTTPTRSSTGTGSTRPGPLLADPLTAVETGYAANRP